MASFKSWLIKVVLLFFLRCEVGSSLRLYFWALALCEAARCCNETDGMYRFGRERVVRVNCDKQVLEEAMAQVVDISYVYTAARKLFGHKFRAGHAKILDHGGCFRFLLATYRDLHPTR